MFFVVTINAEAELAPNGKSVLLATDRTPAFFEAREKAERCIINNWGDIWEGIYNYAVIIEIEEFGLYPNAKEVQWFEWVPEDEDSHHRFAKGEDGEILIFPRYRGGYVPIEKPECFAGWGFTPIG